MSKFLDDLAARFPVRDRQGSWLKIEWPDGPQVVQVALVSIHGRARVFLTADVCPAPAEGAGFSERLALELASRLLVGFPIIENDMLRLRHVLTEGQFTLQRLDEDIVLLRGNAVRFRERLLAKPGDAKSAGTVYEGLDY